MIETPTVLILGAGASKPYDYPLGIDLKDEIIRRLSKLQEYRETRSHRTWLDEFKFDFDFVDEFIRTFDESTRTSIDSFLNYHKTEYETIGKIAIVDIISSCENRKNLLKPEDSSPQEKNDYWYNYLAEFIYKCEFDDIADNKLSIISYNYDRSVRTIFI